MKLSLSLALPSSAMVKKRNRKISLESEDSSSASQDTVFIDTNLDTHLALIVSDTDTVSDLKKKIIYEHPQCFPNFGELKIDALKVKRKGKVYHLSDSVRVCSVFEGVPKCWFLSVDAASLKQRDENRSSTSAADVSTQFPLLCYTETSQGVGGNHISDTPSQKSSHLGATLLPQHGNENFQFMDHKITSTDHSGLGDPLESLPPSSHGGSDVDVNDARQNKRNKSSVADTDYRYTPDGSLTVKPLLMVKCRSKKKNKEIVSNGVKDNDATTIMSDMAALHPQVVEQLPPDSSHQEVFSAMETGGVTPFEASDKLEEHTGDKDMTFVGDDEQLNNHRLEEAPKVDKSTKKKRKRNNEVQEKETLLPSFSKETPKLQAANPENKLKDTTTILGCSLADPPEDLVANGSNSGRKNKKKQKLSREQIGSVDPSSLNDGGEQSKEEIAEVSAKKSAAATVAVVSEQETQPPTLSRSVKDSQKQKHLEAVPKAMEEHALHSLTGIGISVPDPIAADGKNDVPEVGGRNGSKKEKRSKKRHSANANEAPPPVFNEVNDRKSGLVPAGKEGHQNFDESNPEKEERGNSVNIGDSIEIQTENQGKRGTPTEVAAAPSAKLVEKNDIIESGKSTGIRIKREKNYKASKLVELGMEHADNFDSIVSPIAHHSTSIDHHIGDQSWKAKGLSEILGDNTKGDDTRGNEAESLPEAHDNKVQETVGNMDNNLKKGTKRNQSSDAKATMVSPVEEQEKESFLPNQVNMTQDDAENRNEKSRKKSRKGQKVDVKTDVLVGDGDKGVDMSGKQGPSLPVAPANKAQETMENMEGNDRKRTKKNISSNKKTSTSPDMPIQEQNGELVNFHGKPKDADKTEKKTRRAKRSSKDQLVDQKVEVRDGDAEPVTFQSSENATADLEHVPSSNTPEINSVGRRLPFDIDENALKHSSTVAPSSDIEVPKSGTEEVNFKDYFVPVEQKDEAGSVDLGGKLTEVRQSDGEKSKKKGKTPGKPSLAPPADVQNSVKPALIQGSKTKSHSKPSHTLKGIPEKNIQPSIANDPKPVNSVPASPGASRSTSESSENFLKKKVGTKLQPSLDQHRARASNVSTKKIGKVADSSWRPKSLLATPAIFKDSSSESSEGGIAPIDSDASTRAPSDYSSSSDDSVVESKSGRNGSTNATQDGGGDGNKKSQSAGEKPVNMDVVLRSSSSYKKAKLSVSQSQLEDTESQPVEFVPESQPIV